MTIYRFKPALVFSTFLFACLHVSSGIGQQSMTDFSTGSPSRCGNIKVVNGDDVFFISDGLSSEGRKDTAIFQRSQGKKYFEDSERKGSWSRQPPNSAFRLHSGSNEEVHSPFSSPPSFKDSQYNSKLSQMFPRMESEFGEFSQETTERPADFYNFMQNKFTWPYHSETRRFPGQPSKAFGGESKKTPRKKDLLDGVAGKVVSQKRNASKSGHQDTPGKFPKFIQHVLDVANKENGITPSTSPKPEYREREDYSRSIPQRRPMMDSMGGGGNAGLMDILGNLSPDKVQQLKKLLGNDGGKDYNRVAGGNGYSGDRYGVGDRDRIGEFRDNQEEEHRPPTYNLDSYDGGKLDSVKRHRFGVGGGHPPRMNSHQNDIPSSQSSETSGVRALPDLVRPRRQKRAVFPQYPFEKLAEEKGINLEENNNVKDGERCVWIFKKGKNCNRMTVKIQYWIDGVRDCAKEYLKISGGRREGDRLCGGHENLQPYVIEGEKVAIEHYRELQAGPGVTKFRGTIQCQEAK